MNKRQRERLLKLADFLETLPEKNFDMAYFDPYLLVKGRVILRTWLEEDPLGTPSEEIECGTACCVVGWASIVHKNTWPKYGNGEPKVSDYQFRKFFGLSEIHTNKICFSKILLNKKERKALALGDGGEFTSTIKAKQIRQIVKSL